MVRDQLGMGAEDLEWLLRKTAEAVYFFDVAGGSGTSASAAGAASL